LVKITKKPSAQNNVAANLFNAKKKIANWHREDNEERGHSSLNYRPRQSLQRQSVMEKARAAPALESFPRSPIVLLGKL
jgi:hypothetical protein